MSKAGRALADYVGMLLGLCRSWGWGFVLGLTPSEVNAVCESRGGTNTAPCTWQRLLSQHKGRRRLLPLWVGVPWHSQAAWPLLLWGRVVQKPQIALRLPRWWGAAFFFFFIWNENSDQYIAAFLSSLRCLSKAQRDLSSLQRPTGGDTWKYEQPVP